MAERPKKYKKKLTDDEKIIQQAKDRYKRAQSAQSDENKLFDEDVAFAFEDGAQWPEEIRKQRELDGRPCITVNRAPQFIRQVVNDYRQNTPTIKVLPVDDGADKDTAEIFGGIIRHIEQSSHADSAKDNAFLYSVTGGKGFYRVITKYREGTFDQDIYVEPIVNTRSVTYDCDDTSLDGSGWGWAFVEDTIAGDEFDERYPDADRSSWSSENTEWSMDGGEQIRIAEYYYKVMEKDELCRLADGSVVLRSELQEGMEVEDCREVEVPKVKWCHIGGNERKLLKKGDWAGKYIPIVPVFGDVVYIKGKPQRLSLIRFAKDAMRMINFWRSSEAESLSLSNKAPYVVTTSQINGHEEKWENANRVNYPYLEYNSDPTSPPPMRQGFASPPTGILTAIEGAGRDLMDTTGIQESGLGQKSNETSGRAIMARQAESDNATFHFIDNASKANRYLGVMLVDLIPKIYDTPRVVRVLGLDGNEEMKPINQEVEEKDDWGQKIKRIYDLGAGSYDVVVTTGPSYNSKRQEAVDAMSQILQGNPQLMGIAGDLFIKAMDWPGADELAERIKRSIPPELSGGDGEDDDMPPQFKAQIEQMGQQMQQMEQMLQQQGQQLQDKQIEYQFKAQELEIKAMDAETKRLAVMKEQNQSLPAQVIESELSEADKLEIDIEKTMSLEAMKQQHEKDMAVLKAKLEKIKITEMNDLNEDGEMVKSELSQAIEALIAGQAQLANQIQATGDLIQGLATISAAPKRVIRDENGRPVGVEPVLGGE